MLCLKGKNLCEKKLLQKKKVRNLFVRIWPQLSLLNSANIYFRWLAVKINSVNLTTFKSLAQIALLIPGAISR